MLWASGQLQFFLWHLVVPCASSQMAAVRQVVGPPFLYHGQSMSHHMRTTSAGCKSSLQVINRRVRLAVGSKELWLDFADRFFLNPWIPSCLFFFRVFGRFFCVFWSILGPNFGSQKRPQKWTPKLGFNRILNKAANLRPILGSKN